MVVKNYRVTLDEFYKMFLSAYEQTKEEITTYSMRKYMKRRGMHIAWATIRLYLQELEHNNLIKKRSTKNRMLYLPIDAEIIF
ncbi:MAG: hypothetical protein PHS54_07180 [Clostridia bacterium]|jgi:repressor of nif and glnA expression|nr:hypothetical protein [Clostridia bacterium]